jgi:hypothetical protein
LGYLHKDLARGFAALGRSIGGTAITLATGQGARFGSLAAETPMRVSVWRPDADPAVFPEFVTMLRATGVSGDVLTVAGPVDDHADAAVLAGDLVFNGVTAGDIDDVWAEFAAVYQAMAAIPAGADGAQGDPGPKGDPGDDGAQGPAGATGPAGADGGGGVAPVIQVFRSSGTWTKPAGATFHRFELVGGGGGGGAGRCDSGASAKGGGGGGNGGFTTSVVFIDSDLG